MLEVVLIKLALKFRDLGVGLTRVLNLWSEAKDVEQVEEVYTKAVGLVGTLMPRYVSA